MVTGPPRRPGACSVIRRDTRLFIITVSVVIALVLMTMNFGPSYAALGVLAMVARLLVKPNDILRFVPMRGIGKTGYSPTQFVDLVQRFSVMSNIPLPRVLHTSGTQPTAMIVGNVSDSVLVLRGPVHALDAVEREALIGHEIGHLARNHFPVKWATSIVLMFAFISVVRWTLLHDTDASAGNPFLSPATGLALLVTLSFAIIVHGWVGFLIEAEADDHAVMLTGTGDGVAAILRRHLPEANIGNFGLLAYWPIVYRLRRMERRSSARP
jgi:Zn-dependent protease with chaperone function